MKNPLLMRKIKKKLTLIIAFLSLLVTLFFTIWPIFGWSYYSLEKSLVQCSVNWTERSFNVISYNMTMFLLAFLVPFGVIIFCSIRLIQIV